MKKFFEEGIMLLFDRIPQAGLTRSEEKTLYFKLSEVMRQYNPKHPLLDEIEIHL